MKKAFRMLVVFLLSVLGASTVHAADAAHGAQLHNEKCMGCHASRLGYGNNGDDIYIREHRRVQDLAGLKKQVNRCKDMLQITWFDEDVADVVEHLNTQYYKFK